MGTLFPAALDTFPSGATLHGEHQDGSPYAGPALTPYHSTLHGNLGDAVTALEAKVGADGSADPSSLDALVRGVLAAPRGDLHHTFTQNTPASTWVIPHNLGKFPSVRAMDTAGEQIEGDVTDIDANNLTITYSAPLPGVAYLN